MATLLTGAGYIGAVLVRQVLQARPTERLVVLENYFSTSADAVARALPKASEGVRLIEGDISNAPDVGRAFDALASQTDGTADQPVTVFHLAAQPSAAIARRDPERTERTNLTGARVLLAAAHARHAAVVFGGSFRVYGDDLAGQTVDERTPYGRVGDLSHLSKVYVEQLARMLGVRFASVRLGVTYGLSPIMKRVPALMTVPHLFCQRAAKGEPLQVLDDRPMAFIHVEDAAAALLAAAHSLQHRPDAEWQVLNAAPEVASIGQVAGLVQRLAARCGREVRIEGAGASAEAEATFRVRSALAETERWQPRRTLEDGLPEVLDFFLKTV